MNWSQKKNDWSKSSINRILIKTNNWSNYLINQILKPKKWNDFMFNLLILITFTMKDSGWIEESKKKQKKINNNWRLIWIIFFFSFTISCNCCVKWNSKFIERYILSIACFPLLTSFKNNTQRSSCLEARVELSRGSPREQLQFHTSLYMLHRYRYRTCCMSV